MKRKALFSLIALVITLAFIGGAVSQATGLSPLISMLLAGVGLYLMQKLPKPGHIDEHIVRNGIQTEVWTNSIKEAFYANNEFLKLSEDDSAYVEYKTVHKPQAGDDPNVEKNRAKSGSPVSVNDRTDTVVDYSIDEYTTDPFRIDNAEEVELSYDKRASILRRHQIAINDKIADNILYIWSPTLSTNILRTSGYRYNDITNPISLTTNRPHTTAEGTYLVFGLYDVQQAMLHANANDWPQEGRVMVIPATMYNDLVTDMSVSQYKNAESQLNLADGSIMKLMTFNIYVRSKTTLYTNAATPVRKAVGAAKQTTDNGAVLFWHQDAVSRAIGEVKIFETLNSAVYYGDVYSVLMRAGGTKNRNSEVGVGAIVQKQV